MIKILFSNFLFSCFICGFCASCDTYKPTNDKIFGIPEKNNEISEASLLALSDAVENNEKDAQSQYKLAKKYQQLQRNTLALTHIDKALAENPLNSAYFVLKTKILINLLKYDNAFLSIEKAFSLGESSFEAYNLMSYLYINKKEYVKAEEYLQKAQNITSKEASTYYLAGKIAVERYDTARAYQNLFKTLQIKPDFTEAYKELAILSNNYKLYNQTIRYANLGIAQRPKYDSLFLLKGIAFSNAQMVDSAKRNYENAYTLAPSRYFASYQLGIINFKQFYYTKAKNYFLNAQEYNQDLARIHFYLGVCYQAETKEEKALEEFKKAIAQDAQDLVARQYYYALNQKIEQDKYYKALQKQQQDFYRQQDSLAKLPK